MNLLNIDNLQLPALDKTVILTPNNRIARKLLDALAEDMVFKGETSWETPRVYPVASWVKLKAMECQDRGILPLCNLQIIDPEQESSIWYKIIKGYQVKALNRKEGFIGSVRATSGNAQAAWSLVHSWSSAIDHGDFLLNPDGESFQGWANEFKCICADNQYITTSELPIELISAVKQGLKDFDNLVLFAFDDIAPSYQTLLEAFGAEGVSVTKVEPHVNNISALKAEFSGSSDEYRAAAEWAYKAIEENPSVRIGIVVPELSRRRESVLRSFNNVFEPQHILPHIRRYTAPFNISAGVSFAGIPVINEAFRCLSLKGGDIPLEEALALVVSPFVQGGVSEFRARSTVEVKLRELKIGSIPISSFIDALKDCPKLLSAIDSIVNHRGSNRSNLPSQWAISFNDKLDIMGWPGERNLDSEEYQAVGMWSELLDKFSRMDVVTGKCSSSEALSILRGLASIAVFQPETKDSPIQILGSLEAAGLQFTHLWVSGMNDEIWPGNPSPNPYIPMSIQKGGAANGSTRIPEMPHSSPERELEYAKHLTQRYLNSSSHVVFSYSSFFEDKELRVSPLISSVQDAEFGSLTSDDHPPLMKASMGSVKLVDYDDMKGAPLKNGEDVKGGASVLEDQSACPFRAFAKHRLGARKMESIRIGLDSRDRGIIVHAVMESFWNELRSQDELLALSDETLISFIETHVDNVLLRYSKEIPVLKGAKFVSIERKRLVLLCLKKMEIEKERDSFVVVSTEEAIKTSISGLSFHLKVDRINKVSSGLSLEDYKTGVCRISGWSGERMDSPQVPMYAKAYKDKVSSIMFSKLSVSDAGFCGISEEDGDTPGVLPPDKLRGDFSSTWTEIIADWETNLECLASDYKEGIYPVNPKKTIETCRYCDYKPLCRK